MVCIQNIETRVVPSVARGFIKEKMHSSDEAVVGALEIHIFFNSWLWSPVTVNDILFTGATAFEVKNAVFLALSINTEPLAQQIPCNRNQKVRFSKNLFAARWMSPYDREISLKVLKKEWCFYR